tara:strand:- start:32 stop:403 length:372 start_codon:yes stop_codon:yes gene_type:complete
MKYKLVTMTKQQINYSDLSPKELELLKDIYVNLKVKSMNNNDLKNFAVENISLQIKSTIGNEEELEAWHEMEDFFRDEFENTIQEIKIKLRSKKDALSNLKIERIAVKTEDKKEDKKLDMWED